MTAQILTLAALVATALAVPAGSTFSRRDYSPCAAGLYSNAQCCSVNVLDLAALDCEGPPTIPTSPEDFTAICANISKEPLCCVLPVLEQDVLCVVPGGTSA
ncbi:hypothetical protein Sste5346_004707 [Sporothrix stenoceras]|uniref:Hydrophobin n=1 Tax=Sporothrix stenoceras TaxID=5173 RepID=A0ABR3Z924_9PEZI